MVRDRHSLDVVTREQWLEPRLDIRGEVILFEVETLDDVGSVELEIA
jgi:hypothetical protein